MTIKEAAYSISHIVDLSKYFPDGKSLMMCKDYDSIRFIYEDHTIPRYEEKNSLVIENGNYSLKKEYITNDTVKAISHKLPFYYRDVPDRMVAETCGFFYTGDYTLVKGGQERIIDYSKIEDLIKEAIKEFNK